MPNKLIFFKIFIFRCSNVVDNNKIVLCFVVFTIAVSFCMARFRDRTSCIPRYV